MDFLGWEIVSEWPSMYVVIRGKYYRMQLGFTMVGSDSELQIEGLPFAPFAQLYATKTHCATSTEIAGALALLDASID